MANRFSEDFIPTYENALAANSRKMAALEVKVDRLHDDVKDIKKVVMPLNDWSHEIQGNFAVLKFFSWAMALLTITLIGVTIGIVLRGA